MDYETFSLFAGTWGLVLLVVMFIAAMAYALWPSNKEKFEQAAQLPLDADNPSNTGAPRS